MAKKKQPAVVEADTKPESVDISEPFEAELPPPRVRISGDELKARLRQQRRETRLAEKRY